jgi:hypothetical protein
MGNEKWPGNADFERNDQSPSSQLRAPDVFWTGVHRRAVWITKSIDLRKKDGVANPNL